jgi:hypothetical protein
MKIIAGKRCGDENEQPSEPLKATGRMEVARAPTRGYDGSMKCES